MRYTILILAVLVLTPAASAQVGPEIDAPWDTARSYYAEGNYAEAQRYIIEAIQREPRNPMYYAGLARARWGQGDVDQAVYYYNIFLNDLAGEVTADMPTGYRPSTIRDERDHANAERERSDEAPASPAQIVTALDTLDTRIAEGPILNTTGGGALAVYRGLLRSGYAHPSLIQLRVRLANALLSEANTVISDHQAAIPSLSLVQWETQRDRLRAWQNLAVEPSDAVFSDIPASALDPSITGNSQHARAAAHLDFTEGQIQYLNQNWGQASLSFANAVEALDDFVPARIGRLNALYRAGNAAQPALDETDSLESVLERVDRANVGVAQVYRAAFAAQADDSARAADAIGVLIGLERVEEDD
jgi:hypothetical protein